MVVGIDHNSNKGKIAIICVGYNRLKSLKRLLSSLLDAVYPSKDVPLVISIDCSGDEALYKYVREFYWPYGEKFVNIQKERLGLKNHIFQCGDLTRLFKAIVLLEDDLFVSPFFYEYVEKTVEKYGEADEIAEISLYKNESNGYAGFPFNNIQDGNDVFLMQDVSTWGQCWTEQMWKGFTNWRDAHTEDDIQKIDMPDRIKKWERAWSKYYNAYVVDSGKYVLYPNIALTTNFSDAGEHGGDSKGEVQTIMMMGEKKYVMPPISDLVKYDIYDNNEELRSWLDLEKEDVCLDIYGIHENSLKRRYILSSKHLGYKVIKSYALCMRPIELNVKYNIEGNGLFLYDTSIVSSNKKKGYSDAFRNYMMHGIEPHEVWRFTKYSIIDTIKRKIFK